MADPDKMSLKELLEAQKKLMRQIEILRSPVSYAPTAGSPSFPPDNQQLLAELGAELAAVNAMLGHLHAKGA